MINAIPSEFASFVRDTGVRAFDRLAEQARDLDPPLRNFVKAWSKLTEAHKLELFDDLIAAARMPTADELPPPGLRQKKPVKRYDPDEVAATLPKKTARKVVKPAKSEKKKAKPKTKKSE